ncbi:hypothetical protein JTB14_020198 [Gonioctena quinquepunctata]|nr:hypothetical protein JTB14_020198 [Gonioctena quinquepunctata]
MVDTRIKYGPLIGSIDEGTSSTRFLVFASKTAEVLTYHQLEVPFIIPKEGWFEQDPMVILHAVKETIDVTCDNLTKLNISYEDIVAVGITNQRETTVLWDPTTGKPLCNALVWMDIRTSSTVDDILEHGKHPQDFLQNVCGLPVSTYFSALKIKWMMENVEGVKEAIEEGRCLFGTIDTWLVWNLTGGVQGGLHITDVTNASRTMLMNIETLQWDPKLCKVFDIPMSILPRIRSSSEIYGYIFEVTKLAGVPIAGILGDQQAALVGQMCFNIGQAKSTYGTGCFILYNTGTYIVRSNHGLLTTVGYQLGPDQKPIYALEGSVAIAGISLKWLRDNLNVMKNVDESSEMAQSVSDTGEVTFVPAFSGLYAPYWRKDARSVICGLTEETKPGHLVKAALESVCFQVREILEAMALDCGHPLTKLLVDGGMTVNDYLMQMQANYCGIPVVRPMLAETTSLGAAIAAGNAKGVEVWHIEKIEPVPSDIFVPVISQDVRDIKYSRWKMAIKRSLGWARSDENDKSSLDLPRLVEGEEQKSDRYLDELVCFENALDDRTLRNHENVKAVQRLASENSKLSDPKMFAAKRFLPFILLFILHNVSIRCQDEKEKSKKETDDTNSIHSAHHTLRQLNQDIRPFSNTDFEEDEEKDIFNTDYYHTKIRYFRPKRNSPVRSIASIRKRLNEERKRDELMAADSFPKMEPNGTDLIKHALSKHRKGMNSEQLYNRETDKIWQLHQKHISDKRIDYKTGIDCDFENDCQWTWRKDVANGFFITSGGKNGANETGPRVDAEKREGGKLESN